MNHTKFTIEPRRSGPTETNGRTLWQRTKLLFALVTALAVFATPHALANLPFGEAYPCPGNFSIGYYDSTGYCEAGFGSCVHSSGQPAQDWCNKSFCYTLNPYAWKVTHGAKWEALE